MVWIGYDSLVTDIEHATGLSCKEALLLAFARFASDLRDDLGRNLGSDLGRDFFVVFVITCLTCQSGSETIISMQFDDSELELACDGIVV